MWLVVMWVSPNYCSKLSAANIRAKNPIWNFDRVDYYIKELQDEEFMSHDWESLMLLLSIALSCIYIGTILHDILLCQIG